MTTPESESNMVVGLRPMSYSISVGTTPRSGNTIVTFDDLVIEDKIAPSNNHHHPHQKHMHQVTEEEAQEREEFENEFYDAVSPLDFITTQFQEQQPSQEDSNQDDLLQSFSSKELHVEPQDTKKKKKWRRTSSVRTWWRSQKITAAQLWYLALVALVVLMINSDQNLLAPSLTMIAEEFNFTSEEKDLYLGGYLSIAFFATGGFAAILAGFAADVTSRKATFCVIVFIGELSCFCTLFVTDYWGLFVTRLVTGCAIGGSGPVLYSVVGDTFVDEWRGRAASLLVLLSGGGVLVGQTIAALVAPVWGWRVPFAIVSIPAMVATIILYCLGREPTRGSAERVIRRIVEEGAKENIEYEPYSETMSWKKLFKLFNNKTVMVLLILSIPTSLPWGFLLVYAQDYLVYDVGPTIPGGISSAQSMAVVIIFSMAGAVGSIVGGYYTDTLWRKNPVLVPLFSGIGTAMAAIPMYCIANTRMPYYGYCLVVIPAAFLTNLGSISKNAIILNCTVPETRGTAFALNTLFDDLGKGLASFLIALMVVGLGGRVPAFNVAFGGWIVGGFLFAFTAFTVRRDLKRRTDALMASMRVVSKSSSTATDTTSNGGMMDKDTSIITNDDGYETSAMRTSQTDRTTLEDLNGTDEESQNKNTMDVNDRQVAIV